MKNLLRGIPKKYLFINIFCLSIWSIMDCFFVELLANSLSKLSKGGTELLETAIFFIGFILIWEINEFFADSSTNMIMTSMENDINKHYLKEVANIKPAVIKNYNTGYICGLTSKLLRMRDKTYECIFGMGYISIVYIVYCLFRMFSFHYIYGITTFILIAVSLTIRVIFNKKLIKYVDILSEAESNRVKLFNDAVGNITTIQKMQSLEFIKNKMKIITDDCVIKTYKWGIIDALSFAIMKVLMYSFAPICLLLTYLFNLDRVVDISVLVSLLVVMELQLIHHVRHLASTLKVINEYKTVKGKVDKIVEENNKIVSTYIDNFESAEIKNASYQYKTDENSILIQIPEFSIKKGDKICISGESGQGKTTTLNILSGEIETGYVTINGKERTTERLDCSFIAQDTEMLDMTIKENLCMGKDIDEKEILTLIDKVGLSDWLNKQELGLDTFLGERGVFVSTGQRQRLNLIRGLLMDKEIYLLDEPTSNVDEETETRIINLIQERLKDKTVIIVSHRPAISRICNKQFIFENGILSALK